MKTYHVHVIERAVYSYCVEAETSEQAEELAEQAHTDTEDINDHFSHVEDRTARALPEL